MKNFGDLLDSIYKEASIEFGKNKKKCSSLIKECVKVIKTDRALSDQFTVYDNLKNSSVEEKYASSYINENIESLRVYPLKEIISSNRKLENLCKKVGTKVKSSKINESISNLYFLMNTSKNVNSIHKSKVLVKENLISNKETPSTDVPSVPIALMSKIVSKKYNQKYKDLSESDKKILKVILESKEGENKIFDDYKEMAQTLLKKKIVENDDSKLHVNLKKTYNKVLKMKFISENSVNDISKLHYLISGLQ
tara:strand:+ start:13096 stop:13851 length:756 start_codon:yes stop_codon:yes gene_type:complete